VNSISESASAVAAADRRLVRGLKTGIVIPFSKQISRFAGYVSNYAWGVPILEKRAIAAFDLPEAALSNGHFLISGKFHHFSGSVIFIGKRACAL
jgi:hypothetical protein